jgi:hypothetical protein
MNLKLNVAMKAMMRVPYALRRVPEASLCFLLPYSGSPQAGDIALAKIDKIGRNANLELPNGRRCSLHEGDVLAVVFGNRYATMQFEGYARVDEDRCDLLSMGGVCGMVESKHTKAADPSKLRLVGFIGDADGRALNLRQFSLAPRYSASEPNMIVVCGTSMDAGKTHTALSLIMGLRQQGFRVAAIKLTGTATGKDTWNLLDAGACVALDFVDGGFPSTYLCSGEELVDLHQLLTAHVTSHGPDYVVIEIADGLLQGETAATTSRMIAKILAVTGRRVGLASSEGIEISGIQIVRGDMSGSESPQMLLRNPAIDAAVLEVGHKGILSSGLGYDRADVAAVLSVSGDCGSPAGINTLPQVVRLEIDDFGTGYSSLSRLQHFPLDILKIDRSFVSRMDTDPETSEIVRIIVMLAHGLGLKVVAEGVETQRQADMLKGLGCELAQGFLYSRAVPSEAIDQLLSNNRAVDLSTPRTKVASAASA